MIVPTTNTSSSSSSVGNQFQAKITPILPSLVDHPSTLSATTTALYHPIWDPQRARTAQERGEDLEGFLSQSDQLNVKMLLMEALYQGQYNVRRATEIFVAQYLNQPKSVMDYGNADAFAKAFSTDLFAKTKDFNVVAQKLHCSKEIALINYYRWKKSDPIKPDHYLRMKQDRNKESDVCDLCDNGGELIVCDLCNKAYHFYCLTPPLTMIPNGEWFCPTCETRSPAKLRRHLGYHKINNHSSDHSPQLQQPDATSTSFSASLEGDDCVNVAPPERFEALKSIHKELFGGLVKPTIRTESTRTYAYESKVKHATYSPNNMIWNRALGYFVEKNTAAGRVRAVKEMKDKATTNGNSSKRTPITTTSSKNGEHRNPTQVNGNQRSTQANNVPPSLNVAPIRSGGTATTSNATSSTAEVKTLLRGQIYEVRIPIAPEGLLIFIQRQPGSMYTSFSGYRPTDSGDIGYAQMTGAFKASGDYILEVDHVPCFQKSFAEVGAMLRSPQPGSTERILKMFHPLN